MREFYILLANICHVLTLLGCALATWILFMSFGGMANGQGPDFSAVIGVTAAIIPYCAGRVFEALAARASSVERYSTTPCPACLNRVPKAASRCVHCHTDLARVPD